MRDYQIIDTNADNIGGCSHCGIKNANNLRHLRKTNWLRDHLTRREAILAGAAAMGLARLESSADGADEDAAWIDAHSHVWPAETDRFPLAAGLTKRDLHPPSFTDEQLMAVRLFIRTAWGAWC